MTLWSELSLDLYSLNMAYQAGRLTPVDVVEEVFARIERRGADPTWIYLLPRDEVLGQAKRLAERPADLHALPLYGMPFAIKDNIDVAGHPTTAGCPEFRYIAQATATVVRRLQAAGAIQIGKTNMDQFATGLVGVRSPFGACSNAFDPRYISGGSSSGSATAVAAGLVSFSLGTDTAGSGRVPAGFNNIVGVKPTRGRISSQGVVPACRSLDCVSVFALTCEDSQQVLAAAEAFDNADIYSRRKPAASSSVLRADGTFRFGVPADRNLEFFGDGQSAALFERAVRRLESIGGTAVTIDYSPFSEAASLLYGGPWVAERLAAIEPFFGSHADAVHPVVRGVIGQAEQYSALDAFNAMYRLESLKARAAQEWQKMDMLVVPTAPTIYTIAEVEANPVELNSRLGYYTNFVNLFDLAAVAVPAGFRDDGLPAGITLIGPAWSDESLAALASRFHRLADAPLGATGHALTQPSRSAAEPSPDSVKIAVVGAHLSGQPLNYQLTERGARLLGACRTAPSYRLFALTGTVPPKPGLVRTVAGDGAEIEIEVWEMPVQRFGEFVAEIPAPLGIGSLELGNGEWIKGFLCEGWVIPEATDISAYGGWRRYREAKTKVGDQAPAASPVAEKADCG
jgi:allophanate hydrolase